MRALTEEDFEVIAKCPWDGASPKEASFLYADDMGCEVVRCRRCGVVYARRRLNEKGLAGYWDDYLSRVHLHDPEETAKRQAMYQLDYAFSHHYVPKGDVLDVGCGNGSFMDVYAAHGYQTFGVEYGREAAAAAGKKHRVRQGRFDEMDFGDQTFDLIIFRGVLQYIPQPRDYLKKALRLLKPPSQGESFWGGHLFVTAQPNVEAAAFRLFGKRWGLSVNGADFVGFHEKALTAYLAGEGLNKVGEHYFYLETPYADEEEDLLKMAQAVRCKRAGKSVDFPAPAYWGSMMTLMYA